MVNVGRSGRHVGEAPKGPLMVGSADGDVPRCVCGFSDTNVT